MKFKIQITETFNKKRTREYEDEFESIELMKYMFDDGNYGCDCNRAIFFARAGNEADPETHCSDYLFTVKVFDVNNQVVYDDTHIS